MAWFPDWVTGRLVLTEPHEINGGEVISLAADGAVEWRTVKRLPVVGSHESSMSVRTRGRALEFSGNPTKWLQGHNLFGSDDLAGLVAAAGLRLCGALKLPVSVDDLAAWRRGEVELSRVDCTRMYQLPPGTVPAWLSVASAAAYGGHQRVTNRGAYDGNTLYVGQHSRRISLKLYDKAAELARHPLPATMGAEDKRRLTEYAADTLRAEVTIRGMELKARDLGRICDWSPDTGARLMNERLHKLSMLDNRTLADDVIENLPPRLADVYDAWRAGRDLRARYSRAQFYRYRTKLLPYGIDIAKVRPRVVRATNEYAMGRPLREFISGDGVGVPEWAKGTELLAAV